MKNLTVIDAINELIKGVNMGFARNAYNMAEVTDIYLAIQFLNETINKAQQAVPAPPSSEEPTTPI